MVHSHAKILIHTILKIDSKSTICSEYYNKRQKTILIRYRTKIFIVGGSGSVDSLE